jgi:drug/metabolite transporter (DMT)-like permease
VTRAPALLALHVSVLLFGVAGLFGKLLLLPPLVIVLGRVAFASAALAVIVWARRLPIRARDRRDAFGLVGLGILLAVHWAAFFHSIQLSSVAIGLLTYSTFPVFTAFLEPLLLKERWSWSDGIAAAVTFAGVALVIPELDWANTLTRGAFWGVIAGFTFALLSIANRGFAPRYHPLVLALHQDFWAMVVLLPSIAMLGAVPGRSDVLLLVLLGVVFTALAHGLFIRGLKDVRARTASVIATLEPVYGIIFAIVLLGEGPAARTVLGGLVILGAAGYVTVRGS